MRTRLLVGTAASAGAVAIVTGAVYALEPAAPVLSLGVLYLFAVLPVAAIWGLRFAVAVSVVSMLTFNWRFLPPRHTFHLRDSENWVALAVYLVTAVSVSALAARARRRAAEAEQQRREAAFAAQVSALLLGRPSVESQLAEIAVHTADLLGVSHCWIELGSTRGQARKYRALLVEKVPGDRAREVLDGAVNRGEIGVFGTPGREPTRGVEQARHHLVVTAVRALELSEAGKLHGQLRFHAGGHRLHRRRRKNARSC